MTKHTYQVHSIDNSEMYYEDDASQVIGEFENLDEAIDLARQKYVAYNPLEVRVLGGIYKERVTVSDGGETIFDVEEDWQKNHPLVMKAFELVKERIPGFRKGTNTPAYEHSVHVYETLEAQNLPPETCLAGLLHDIVEDGDTTLEELSELGFPPETIALVDLCTHDMSGKYHGDARWVMMIARLIEADNIQAWFIKLADISDNAKSCHTMSPERAKFIKQVKVPLLLSVTANLLEEEEWKKLKESIEYQI